MPVKKSVSFFISFFATLAFLSIISYIVNPLMVIYSNEIIINVFYPLIFTIALIFFAFFQSLLRYYFNKKVLNNSKVFLITKCDKFLLKEKLWFYVFVALIYFAPVIRALSLSYLNFSRITLFIMSIGIVELLLRISSRSMKIYFLDKGILVTGFDMRIEIPMGQGLYIHNDSGYYIYENFDGYIPYGDKIELYMSMESGKIVVPTDKEKMAQIMFILKEKKIKIRKYI